MSKRPAIADFSFGELLDELNDRLDQSNGADFVTEWDIVKTIHSLSLCLPPDVNVKITKGGIVSWLCNSDSV